MTVVSVDSDASASSETARSGMRILYLCHRVPYPPDKGDKIRAFHQIQALSRRHQVHLLTLADSGVPDLSKLYSLCERVEVFPIDRRAAYARAALGALRPRPLTLSFFESADMHARVRELARGERFDMILVYSSAMAPYAEPFAGVPAVLDMVDVDSAKWEQYARFAPLPMRPVYALEARRLQAYEASLAERFERVVLTTGNETRLFKSFAPAARAVTIPNGVDFEFFQPMGLPRTAHPTLVFTGQMDYFANVDGVTWFARSVFPRLRQRFPKLEFLIVGRSPAPAVRALGEIPGVVVTGAVGDVRPFLERAWAFVAPLRIAQGVQNKVLEAMAMHVPVVCSDKVLAGLIEGGFRAGRDVLAAADEPEWEAHVATLLDDRQQGGETGDRLAESARQRLSISYRWSANLERLDTLLGEAAAQRGAAASPADGGEPIRLLVPAPVSGEIRSA